MSSEKPVVSGGSGPVGGCKSRAAAYERLLEPRPLVVIFVLLMLAAVSGGSLWIDEIITVYFAVQPTIGQWWHVISTSHANDLQMPFYMIFIWGIEKIFGTGEFPLRLAGTLWLVPGLTAFVVSFPRGLRRLAALLVAGSNAFIWYYANEARPYAMQLGGSFLVFAALNRLASGCGSMKEERRWLHGFAFGLWVVCGSSMLAMIWASAALGAAGSSFRRNASWAGGGRSGSCGSF